MSCTEVMPRRDSSAEKAAALSSRAACGRVCTARETAAGSSRPRTKPLGRLVVAEAAQGDGAAVDDAAVLGDDEDGAGQEVEVAAAGDARGERAEW